MSTPNDNRKPYPKYQPQPSPAAVEQALAEEKANADKIGATVQAARAMPLDHGALAEQFAYVQSQDDLQTVVDYVGRLERERDDLHRQVEGLLASELALQAQRDELLAAARRTVRWIQDCAERGAVPCEATELIAAIARATQGGTGQ